MVDVWKDRLYRLLRWSERYTKTDMVYLASGGFWSVVGQVAASVSSLALAITAAHLLSKDTYGTYKYILSIVAILGAFSLSGLSTAVFQSAARGYDGALQEGFWTNLRWSVLVWLGALVLAIYYWHAGNNILATGVLLGGCLAPFLTSGNLAASYLAAKKDFRRLAIYFDVIENIIPVTLLIVTISLTPNPAVIAIVYFAANTAATFWLYKKVVRRYRPSHEATDAGMLAYGKHLSFIGIISGIAGNIDQVLLFHFVGPAQLAIYNFATAIPDQTKGPLKNLDQMIQARFVGRKDTDIATSMWSKTRWLILGSVAFIVVYIIASPFIYKWIFPAYVDATFYSQVYALSMIGLIATPAGSYLVAKKRVRAQYFNSILSAFVQILFLVVGAVIWGLWGVIIARVATRLIGNMLTYLLYIIEKNSLNHEIGL
jgi:O-antigen/teichoic acid export membrane protein